ncbi:hypothetical protein SCLCIDRAFT_31361 [Scleroderma citrinum Foug A]|uniref:Uncharacterized protein n=1 Tax=Scleroderma citrinum Foug A TaxID=1036808 RepID=A0A0C2ZNE4_9AGAM|nr:hypothetical protein SCLCIDRAFT_31361 [Scleroderma citrinum Foug A]
MFPINAASSFNFSPTSPLSHHTTNPILPSGNDHIDDDSFASPLANKAPGLMGTQGLTGFSYSAQISPPALHQGAYMHNPQLSFLQDRCNALKCNLIQVTAERDTIKNLFNQLTSAVKSPSSAPTILEVDSFLQEMNKDEKPLTCETHKEVRFWMRKDYNDWLDSPEAQRSNHSLYGYLKKENSEVPEANKLENAQKKNACNTVKEEASDEDKDLVDHKPVIIKKRKGHTDALQPSSKKQKEIPVHDFRLSEEEDTLEQSRDSEEPCTIHSTKSAVHPMESNTLGTLPTQASMSQLECSANKENTPVVNNMPATHGPVSYDPMLLLAGAASKVKVVTVPPIPDPPKPCPAGPSHLLDKQWIWNLCMLRWLKQVNANRQKDEFRAYYNKVLIPAQREAYNKEAKELVDTNGWSKVVIETGKLY